MVAIAPAIIFTIFFYFELCLCAPKQAIVYDKRPNNCVEASKESIWHCKTCGIDFPAAAAAPILETDIDEDSDERRPVILESLCILKDPRAYQCSNILKDLLLMRVEELIDSDNECAILELMSLLESHLKLDKTWARTVVDSSTQTDFDTETSRHEQHDDEVILRLKDPSCKSTQSEHRKSTLDKTVNAFGQCFGTWRRKSFKRKSKMYILEQKDAN